MNLVVKVKKLSKDAVIPTYKHETDAGFDLCSEMDIIVRPGATETIGTGLAFSIPKGYEVQVRPRSGITSRTPLRVHLGTIDAGYHGNIMIIVENTLPKSEYTHNRLFKIDGAFESIGVYEAEIGSFIIHKGDRIAQAVISPVIHADFEEVDELGDSERGAAGFGSTGVNG